MMDGFLWLWNIVIKAILTPRSQKLMEASFRLTRLSI